MKQIFVKKRMLSLLLAGLLFACGTPVSEPTQTDASGQEPAVASEAPADPSVPVEETEIEVIATATVEATLAPVPTPVPTPDPTPTPEPTEAPTPEPEPIRFIESEDMPLPNPAAPIMKGRPFTVDGTVLTLAPLLSVRAEITNRNGKVVSDVEQTFEESDNVTEYRLLDLSFSRDIECLSEKIRFDKLSAGGYTLTLSASDAQGHTAILCSAPFTITADRQVQLLPNNLRGNYTTALAFFGSPERFMFRYRFRASDSNQINIDSAWLKQYDAEAVVINGKKWHCHIDAVPYFEQAGRYMETTYIRIHGSKLDTGAVQLSKLVEMNGTTVRRFVNSGAFVSHHSFGTAVDINAHTPSHRDKLANREVIYHEVTENLTYNGIVEYKGQLVYDFTYTGKAQSGRERVPEPLMNYLLYELAFFRTGFSWGLYYPHTCDAMHFSLSELSPSYFEEGPYAMRKVFSYIEDMDGSEPAETEAPEETPAP